MRELAQGIPEEIGFLLTSSGDKSTGIEGLSPEVWVELPSGTFALGTGSVRESRWGWYNYLPSIPEVSTNGEVKVHVMADGVDDFDRLFLVRSFLPTNIPERVDASLLLAKKTQVDAIPLNPLLTTDSRLENLDRRISLTSTFDGVSIQQVVGSVGSVVAPVVANGGTVDSVTGAVGSVTAPVVAGVVEDKTGYRLADTEDTPLPMPVIVEAANLYGNEVADLVYFFKKEFVPPEGFDVVTVQVHRAETLNSTIWPIVFAEDYVFDVNQILFISRFSGYFRLSFLDSAGNNSLLSEAFTAMNIIGDLDLTFTLEPDSAKWISGDKRFITILTSEAESKIEILPEVAVSVWDGQGELLIDKRPALVDGMQIKYLLDTTDWDAGKYAVAVSVSTGYEVIHSKRLKFSVATL